MASLTCVLRYACCGRRAVIRVSLPLSCALPENSRGQTRSRSRSDSRGRSRRRGHSRRRRGAPTPVPTSAPAPSPAPCRSVHATSFPSIANSPDTPADASAAQYQRQSRSQAQLRSQSQAARAVPPRSCDHIRSRSGSCPLLQFCAPPRPCELPQKCGGDRRSRSRSDSCGRSRRGGHSRRGRGAPHSSSLVGSCSESCPLLQPLRHPIPLYFKTPSKLRRSQAQSQW